VIVSVFTLYACNNQPSRLRLTTDELYDAFMSPPDSVRPGVYWYFMDGNISKDAMTKDLEFMKEAGIGSVVFLEVNVGVPRGNVNFLGKEWQDCFAHAVKEAERLNIAVILGAGPGWAGSGGPWIKPEQSMQHLVSSSVSVSGNGNYQHIKLPVPMPKKPYFGEGVFTQELKEKWLNYYRDVAVLAFPTPSHQQPLPGIDEKALYYREPYSSVPNVKPRLSIPAVLEGSIKMSIPQQQIIDLSDKLTVDGKLNWKVPQGNWTVMRFGSRNNGAVTRPAPLAGLGFEVDKMDSAAFRGHLENYVGVLLKKIGTRDSDLQGGLKRLHIDSWEMGAQNWTASFREEFTKRRGYDPLTFYPVYAGYTVVDTETSERFLWDLRLTTQELILANHANYLKNYSHRHRLKLSIEPYDMNPNSDFDLGAIADVPMAEFWSKDYGFNTVFSVHEATSLAHVGGKQVVAAEAFTAQNNEAWKQYPEVMKNQGDWAFASGINQFLYHTFQHQSLPDSLRPGMTMGPYGVHWDRNQTWWPLVGDYHRYIARCSYMLQQGRTVADILYVTPEGAPQVFTPPSSATTDDAAMPDKRGYNFDGCSPLQLMHASVKNHQIVFPSGARYEILVLPKIASMTPQFINKIKSLVQEGATVVGNPPKKSPSLVDYPTCDQIVKSISMDLWGTDTLTRSVANRPVGKGEIRWGAALYKAQELYPTYECISRILKEKEIVEDFKCAESIRYTHRTAAGFDIYFLSNKTAKATMVNVQFRVTNASPELWDPINGERRLLPEFNKKGNSISLPIMFEPYQSYFVVFPKSKSKSNDFTKKESNNIQLVELMKLNGDWKLTFDTHLGGPKQPIYDILTDWTKSSNDSVKYYSGIANYERSFDCPKAPKAERIFIDLGSVKNMARVYLNGQNLGTVWTAPWRIDVTEAIKEKNNRLKIEVANLWINRLIGDQAYPDDGVRGDLWPEWLSKGRPRDSRRITFTTFNPYDKNDTLRSSGLLGPVSILEALGK
jgi:hypothetical protein